MALATVNIDKIIKVTLASSYVYKDVPVVSSSHLGEEIGRPSRSSLHPLRLAFVQCAQTGRDAVIELYCYFKQHL